MSARYVYSMAPATSMAEYRTASAPATRTERTGNNPVFGVDTGPTAVLLDSVEEGGEVTDLGEYLVFDGDLLLLDVFAKMMFGVLVRHLTYFAEVGTAVCFGIPVGVLADLFLVELGLSHGVTGFQWPDESQNGNESGNRDRSSRQAWQGVEYYNEEEQRFRTANRPWECLHIWWWPWSSKSVGGVNNAACGFDSHTLPISTTNVFTRHYG